MVTYARCLPVIFTSFSPPLLSFTTHNVVVLFFIITIEDGTSDDSTSDHEVTDY